MILFYGVRSRKLAAAPVSGDCQVCGNRACQEMNLMLRYVHVFWLPIFPIGKKAVITCQQCQSRTEKASFTELQLEQLNELRNTHRTPAQYYIGIIILTLLVLYGIWISNQRSQRNASWLQSPLPGDIYEIRMSADEYSLLKVHQRSGDTVLLQFSDLMSNKRTGLRKLYLNGFKGDTTRLTLHQLKAMHDDGEIVDVKRE